MSDATETVERLLTAYNRHDAAAFVTYFTPDGVLRTSYGEANQGREQIAAAVETFWAALDYTLETRGLYECGEHVWLEWTLTGRHVGELMGIPATGRAIEGVRGCSHFTFAPEGLVAEDLVYPDLASILRQIGVLPEPDAAQSR